MEGVCACSREGRQEFGTGVGGASHASQVLEPYWVCMMSLSHFGKGACGVERQERAIVRDSKETSYFFLTFFILKEF